MACNLVYLTSRAKPGAQSAWTLCDRNRWHRFETGLHYNVPRPLASLVSQLPRVCTRTAACHVFRLTNAHKSLRTAYAVENSLASLVVSHCDFASLQTDDVTVEVQARKCVQVASLSISVILS